MIMCFVLGFVGCEDEVVKEEEEWFFLVVVLLMCFCISFNSLYGFFCFLGLD